MKVYKSKYRIRQRIMPVELKHLIQSLARSKRIDGNELIEKAVLAYASRLKLTPTAARELEEYLANRPEPESQKEDFEAQAERLTALHALKNP